MQLTPRTELENRLSRVQARIKQDHLDGLMLFHKTDVFYLTGTAQNGVVFVPPEGNPVLAIRRSAHRAKTESAWGEVDRLRSMRALPDLLASRGHAGLRRVGMDLGVTPARFYLQIGSLFPDAEVVDASLLIREVRMIKSAYEIERIEQAAEQLRVVMAEIPAMMREGCAREIDLAARIEGALRRQRHQGVVRCRRHGLEMHFGVVSTGASASYPTEFEGADGMEGLYAAVPLTAGERLFRQGEPIMIDLLGGYDGYLADKTRIFCPGGLRDEEMLRAHHFALQIQEAVQARLRPGAHAGRLWQAVEEMVADSPFQGNFMGYGDNQSRFVGHGVGLELDELPILTGKSETVLKQGMVIAVEPKFFFGDRGGVGIENTWVVTQDGCRNLTADDDAIVPV